MHAPVLEDVPDQRMDTTCRNLRDKLGEAFQGPASLEDLGSADMGIRKGL